ncbi:hypothetical protein ADP74_03505 [Bacillus cereus]|nr:hypothetical protein [Bacillus cereus]
MLIGLVLGWDWLLVWKVVFAKFVGKSICCSHDLLDLPHVYESHLISFGLALHERAQNNYINAR